LLLEERNIGHVTVEHLVAKGFSVRVIDHVPEQDIDGRVAEKIRGADYRQVDIRDYDDLYSHFDNIDGVAHLAAIPYPTHGRKAELFSINAVGTFNLFHAAANAGIKRVVCASSINFLGNGFSNRWIDVQYFPIDEVHPGYTTDVYAFSKVIVEAVAQYFWRREGIPSICMRYPFVYNPMWFTGELFDEFQSSIQSSHKALIEMHDDERRSYVEALISEFWDIRQKRNSGEIDFFEMLKFFQSTPGAALLFGRDDFWSVLDVRDAARSIELALTAEYEGCHPLYIAAAHNSTGLPSRDLGNLFYPEVQTWKRHIEGAETLLNTEKARELLGFEPGYSIS
jgi:nucleoside-diphosphate-sugar epimerase